MIITQNFRSILLASNNYSMQDSNSIGQPYSIAAKTNLMLPTPRSSTSPLPHDCTSSSALLLPDGHPKYITRESDWPGRGRTPWRAGNTPPHQQQQKRKAALMADQVHTEGHPTKKRQRTSKTRLPVQSPDISADSTNWQFREPTASNSRRSSPVRGVLEELRNSTPKVTLDAQATMPDELWDIRQKMVAVVRKAYIPIGLRVWPTSHNMTPMLQLKI